MTSPLLSALTTSTPGPDMNTATQTAAHWLDILPALPLAKGVPVLTKTHSLRAVVAYVSEAGVVLADRWAVDSVPGTAYRWRVDLDDPQGFGYALRHLISSSRPTDARFSSTGTATLRHWLGQTTGVDRLALAYALAEVQA